MKTGQQLVTPRSFVRRRRSERSVRSAIFPDGRQIVTASADISRSGDFAKPLRIWDAATGRSGGDYRECAHDPRCLGRHLLPGRTADDRHQVRRRQGCGMSRAASTSSPSPAEAPGCCRALAVSPDGRFPRHRPGRFCSPALGCGHWQGADLIAQHKDAVTSASFRPMPSASLRRVTTGRPRSWDLHRGRELLTLEGL